MKKICDRNGICLYTAIFAYFLSVYMFSPFFSMYVKALGGSYTEFALALSVTGFVMSLVQSYIGYLSDKIGSGMLVMIGGSISAAGMMLIGVFYDKLFVFPLYLLMNIGMGILVPSVFSLISYRKSRDGDSLIPAYRSIQGAGVIVGPVLGGWIIGNSYRGNVFASGFLMMLSVVLFAICFLHKAEANDQSFQRSRISINFKEALLEIKQNQAFLLMMLLFTMIELSYDLIRLNLPIAGEALQIAPELIGMALSSYFVMFTLFQMPINRNLRKIKKRTALLGMGILALIPCSALVADLPDFCTVIIMAGIGLTIGSLFTFCTVLASEESPADRQGTYMGVFNTIMPCTNMISPLFTAVLAGIHVKAPYLLAVLLLVIFVLLSAFLYRDRTDSTVI